MLTALLVILLFVLMIFPHELGHFLVAKACNVQVNEFSLGMGPAILKKQKGETLYSLRAIPIGGYCAMEGEDGGEGTEENPRAFNNKAWWQKLLVLFAGATMNVVVAYIVLTGISIYSGFPTTTLESVTENMPAMEAGVRAGDRIIEIDGVEISSWNDVNSALAPAISEKSPVELKVNRNGEELSFSMIPREDENGNVLIGIQSRVSHSLFKGFIYGGRSTVNLFKTLFSSIAGIFKAENPLEQVSGPVGIVQVVSETRTYGAYFFFYLVALISINLAIINLLPLPALDGGRIIFVLINLITGKAITEKVEGIVHAVGMGLLILLMLFITWHDITRLFG